VTRKVDDVPDSREPLPDLDQLASRVGALVASLADELVEIRRDLHAHPEPARAEHRTTDVLVERLELAGLRPRRLPGTGLLCDIGPASAISGRPRVALRADIDALPLADACGLPWASRTAGVAHACGHDVHTAAVLGAGLVLAELDAAGLLVTGVRLIFQPAEEVQPGGSLDVIGAGGLEGVAQVFAVHCDPRLEVGRIGTRVGPITSASDEVKVSVTAPGGHTSRPHLTGDVVFALGQVITQVPAILGRRLDPRSGVNLTWGAVAAGSAYNVIPGAGSVQGTLRCLDARSWELATEVFMAAVEQVLAPYQVEVEVSYVRGVPPVENDADAVAVLEAAARLALGPDSVTVTEQSLGGEDFAWYLTHVPGAMARLGTRSPGGRVYDIHQGDFSVDEEAIEHAARLLAVSALVAGRAGAVPIG